MTARYYRYRGMVVRVYEGALTAVTVPVGPGMRAHVPAVKGRFPRAARMYAPLPKKLRRAARKLAETMEQAARKQRLAEQGVQVVENDLRPWEKKQPVPVGASAPWTDLGKLK